METPTLPATDNPKATAWQFAPGVSDVFNANEVINAYFEGKEVGKSEIRNAIVAQLSSTLDEVGVKTQEIVKYLDDNKLGFEDALLKIEGYNSFTILIIVPQDSYIEPKFKNIYEYVGGVEDSLSNTCEVLYSFTGKNNHFDFNILTSEGYKLKLANRKNR